MRPLRPVFVWLTVLAICVALRLALRDNDYLIAAIPYMLISVATPIAIMIGVRLHRPAHRGGWLLLAAGQLF
ncbi:MAG TPA: hypothetical protein VN408_41085, partial [Actinoplanes sp.]|nr:hypothetical protein [Actinoplanes sp.]